VINMAVLLTVNFLFYLSRLLFLEKIEMEKRIYSFMNLASFS
jgi:hypothetical protein